MPLRLELLSLRPGGSESVASERAIDLVGEAASALPGVVACEVNRVVDFAQRGISHKRGPELLDGIVELVFPDDAAMLEALASDAARHVERLAGSASVRRRALVVERREVIAVDASRRPLKRMALLRRRPDVDEARFDAEWRLEHARLVKLMPGVRGYRQSVVVGREADGRACGYDALAVDGVVELWFDDLAAIDHAFSTPQGVELMAHAATFIDEITTFLVEARRLA